MQTTAITTTAFRSTGSALFDGPRVAERSRGTAHPTVPTTRPLLALRGPRRTLAARHP